MVVRAPGVFTSAVAKAMVFALLLSALLAGAASAQTNVSSCTTISSPGTYILNTSITNTTPVVACINITSSNVVLDGASNRVYGADILNTYGVFVFNSTTALSNVTVKNLNVTDWYYGIYSQNVQNGRIENNNASSNSAYGITLASSNNNNLTNNNASSNGQDGIVLNSSSNNTLSNNIANSNSANGIYLSSSSNSNTVTFNNASSNSIGINLELSNSNVVDDNKVTDNNASGVYLSSSSSNTISNNNISSNNQLYYYFFSFSAGIYFVSSNDNTITSNYISNNPQFGVYLTSSTGNTFDDNDIVFNCGGNSGITLYLSDSNTIKNSNISFNTGIGVQLLSSNNNVFLNNNIDSNGQDGVDVFSSTGNTFSDNTINFNSGNGVYLDSSDSSTISGGEVNGNNINGYSIGGLYLSSSWNISIKRVAIHNNTNAGIYDETFGGCSPCDQNFTYNKISGSTKGIHLVDESNSNIIGNEIWNTTDGILLDSSGYYGSLSNNITQNHIHDNQNGISIVLFYYSGSNIVTQNHIHDNQNGITLTTPSGYGYGGGDTIFDNLFNNTNNVNIDTYSQGLSNWNTTKTAGTNIVGRSFIGGNFWAYPNGTGFSETCADSELDGICDSPYVIDLGTGNVDFLPLNTLTGITIPPIVTPPMDANTTNSSGLIDLANNAFFNFSQTLINQMGVIGYEYIVTTNGTTPAVNISVDIFIEPPTGVTNISNVSGALPGFYYQISVNDSSWFSNVTNIQLKIFYNSSNLPPGVSESTLRPIRFTNGSWVRLDCAELGGCSPFATLADGTKLFDAGVVTSAVNATHPFVWANLSNFSVYGLGGSITPSPAAPAPTGTYKPQAVVLANSIDRALASDFIGFLRNQGIEVIEATAANFDSYKSSARFVIILGGPNAPEGIGEIVRVILSEDEQKFLRARGNRKMYVKTNIWRTGQVVRIIAGSGRSQTQEEWQANKEDIGRRIRYNLD